ncbi:MAG: carboxypeptidase regulatory-like domain-containing protein, partial [Planctomycetota bacterium JB042]
AVDALDEGVKIDAVSRAAGSRRVADVFTDAEGRYRVSGLRPGRYRAVAGGPGMFGFGGSGHRRSEPTEVEVRDGELLARVDFRLQPGGMLAGRVVDRDGNAVAAATVFLVPAGGPSERHFGEILSDETGAYHANGLDPDRYVLVVKAPGLAPAIESGVRIREAEETVRDVTLRDGAALTLELRDSGGAAVVGASVRLFGPDGTELTRFVTIGDALSEVVLGGTPGTVALGSLEPGTYTARIERGGAAETVTIQHGGADQVVPVTLP